MGPLTLICALPLLGFLVNGVAGPRLPSRVVASIGCALPALSFVVAATVFARLASGGAPVTETLFTWVAIPGFAVDVALHFDAITAVMCLVVTGVGTLIHVYSVGYMAGDKGFARYFAYLNLFLFFMLVLVLGKNLIVLFVGWEGVGLASYLLIGFWFEDREKTAAGLKAFVVNRVGDTGFIIAAILIYLSVGSLDFQTVNEHFAAHAPSVALTNTIALLLLLGACGKSAQIPLHVWLPDAMAGPTPVSALIHAATMVTAGVYLLARMSGLYLQAPAAMAIVAWIGAATALLGATIAVTQYNLKKVLAYSTISQIGFMVMACGLGAFAAGLFHLVTHAFFKACLFLGAGAVLHALHGEEDMRNMGALAGRLRFTFATFVIASLALCGLPPFAGFFSKDEILWQAWSAESGSIALWAAGIAASALTAFYIFRAIFLTFLGPSRIPDALMRDIHAPPPSMSVVLAILAAGSLLVGFLGLPNLWREITGLRAPLYDFVAQALPPAGAMHHSLEAEALTMIVAIVAALAGIALAWTKFRRRGLLDARAPGYVGAVVARGYFFDALYERVIVRSVDWLSESALGRGIEPALARLVLARPADGLRYASSLFARLQTGNVQQYVLYALAGLVLTLWWIAGHA